MISFLRAFGRVLVFGTIYVAVSDDFVGFSILVVGLLLWGIAEDLRTWRSGR